MDNMAFNDQDIMTKMLLDSKASLHLLTVALSEATSPQLREIWTKHLNQSIDKHFILADAVVSTRYDNNTDPINMIKKDTSIRLKL
jgi:spore coat protein CotF